MGEDRADGLWAPQRRALTAGLVLSITFVASEALAVVTVMPVAAHDLGGLRLYGWVFSGFMLGSVIGIVLASATIITGIITLAWISGLLTLVGIAFTALGIFLPHLLHLP